MAHRCQTVNMNFCLFLLYIAWSSLTGITFSHFSRSFPEMQYLVFVYLVSVPFEAVEISAVLELKVRFSVHWLPQSPGEGRGTLTVPRRGMGLQMGTRRLRSRRGIHLGLGSRGSCVTWTELQKGASEQQCRSAPGQCLMEGRR